MDGVQVSDADVLRAVCHLQLVCVILYPPPSFYTIQKHGHKQAFTPIPSPVQIMSITLTFCENFYGQF